MLKLKMFVVYDSKGESYASMDRPPLFMASRGEALRLWQSLVNDGQSMFSKFPADFTIFEIAELDCLTGNIVPYETKVNLGLALEFKNKEASQLPLLKAVDETVKGN